MPKSVHDVLTLNSIREDRFCLIAGSRRLTACKTDGLTEIPCIIREGSDSESTTGCLCSRCPRDVQDLVGRRAITIKAALEIGKIDDAECRARLAAKSDQMKIEYLKSLVANVLEKPKMGRKKYEKRAAQRLFKEIFEGLPVKRVYKDQVTFVFTDESEFITALKKVIERHESENWEL